MNIDEKMLNVTNTLKNINTYDVNGFIAQLEYLVGQLEYFYGILVEKQGNDPIKTYYKPKKRPIEGQIAYFNLTRGFPKETYDGHWCYILKDYGYKLVVIPATSVKPCSSKLNSDFEFDIEIDNFGNNSITRLQITDIRCIDIQRLYVKKPYYNVKTDKLLITSKIKEILFS